MLSGKEQAVIVLDLYKAGHGDLAERFLKDMHQEFTDCVRVHYSRTDVEDAFKKVGVEPEEEMVDDIFDSLPDNLPWVLRERTNEHINDLVIDYVNEHNL